VDNPAAPLDRISIDPAGFLKACTVEQRPDLLGGVAIIRGPGRAIQAESWGEVLYCPEAPGEEEITLTAVPYCTWDNREPGEMRVWLRAW